MRACVRACVHAFSLQPSAFQPQTVVDATALSLDHALRTETDSLVHVFYFLWPEKKEKGKTGSLYKQGSTRSIGGL